jgi:bifunctional non-homologous end joining protein LigD
MAQSSASSKQSVEVDGRRLALSNLDKVLYPETRTTKGEVIDYYARIAPVLLPHLHERPVTRKRWPNGVESAAFFEKNSPQGTPAWVRTQEVEATGQRGGSHEHIDFPFVDGLATLIWLANLAALELHIPQWTVGPRGAVRRPDRLVIDLDPGPGAGLPECCEVAWAVRERLAVDGLTAHPVTSGSKGMQLYAAVSGKQDAGVVRAYAKALAEELVQQLPKLVVSRMTKTLRPGKVLLDWSQNTAAKTTISPYSLRGRQTPCVAAPRTWEELEKPAELRQQRFAEVLEIAADQEDPLADLFRAGPRVPTAGLSLD